jgi:hypothetical protein
MRKLIDQSDPELVLGGEGPYDLQNRHYTLSYHRTYIGHIPAIRYIDPFLPMMNWVYGYDDRDNVNMCLLYRYIISYEPRSFRGHLEEFPLTLAYGKKVDALRKRYREFLWDAEFQDTVGATVEAVAEMHAPGSSDPPRDPGLPPGGSLLIYSVFRRVDSGRKAVVLVNHGTPALTAKVTTGWKGHLVSVSPEDPEPRPVDDEVQLKPRSAVVVMETA